MANGVVWYDSVANNFKAWLSGVLTTIPFLTLSEISFTTTGNIDNLDFSNTSIIRMNNASDATIRGLLAGTPGQIVTIVSVGAGNVYLAHQDVNSSANNRLLNKCTSGVSPLAAGTGSAVYQYDGVTGRWRLVSHEQGAWISVPFDASNFTANGAMTWTVASGDVIIYAFHLRGKTLSVVARVFVTTVGGVASDQLRIQLPNGYTFQNGIFFVGRIVDNGTPVISIIRGTAGTSLILSSRLDGVNLTLAVDNTAVDLNCIFEVT